MKHYALTGRITALLSLAITLTLAVLLTPSDFSPPDLSYSQSIDYKPAQLWDVSASDLAPVPVASPSEHFMPTAAAYALQLERHEAESTVAFTTAVFTTVTVYGAGHGAKHRGVASTT